MRYKGGSQCLVIMTPYRTQYDSPTQITPPPPQNSYSRTSMMFFVVAFLTFMAIAGFPAFVEDMSVFMRERMNGCVGVDWQG